MNEENLNKLWQGRISIPRWVVIALGAVLVIVLGSSLYNGGWSQGFLTGLLVDGTSGETANGYLAYGGRGWRHGGGFGVFSFFGFVFKLFFFFFLFALFAKFLGFWHWRMHNGGHGGGWHGQHGQHGPWGQPPQQPSQPQAGQPSTPQGTPSAGENPENKPQPTSWINV